MVNGVIITMIAPTTIEMKSAECRTSVLTLPTTLRVAIKPSILMPPINEIFLPELPGASLSYKRSPIGRDHTSESILDASLSHR